MKLKIVYTSNTGHTKEYAELLGKELGLQVYDLKTAVKELVEEEEVIYLGWLMAGQVKGYKKAIKKFKVKAVCGVGMAATGSQVEDIRKTNSIPLTIPVFCVQGGFELDKLHGIYKLMMTTMKKTVAKSLSNKKERTAEEDEMLELLEHGGNKVCLDNLEEMIRWVKKE